MSTYNQVKRLRDLIILCEQRMQELASDDKVYHFWEKAQVGFANRLEVLECDI